MVVFDRVLPARTVGDLGIYLDSDLSMQPRVIRITSWLVVLQKSELVAQSLSDTLAMSRLDYGNANLVDVR